eukprot:6193897-Pleurochrysis_carterae.AAC.2
MRVLAQRGGYYGSMENDQDSLAEHSPGFVRYTSVEGVSHRSLPLLVRAWPRGRMRRVVDGLSSKAAFRNFLNKELNWTLRAQLEPLRP